MASIQQQAQKNFLFYSNYCHHSKRLLDRIKSSNLVNNINIICIDNPQYNIPGFIEVVPTLYDPINRRVIVNDELFGWIESVLGGINRQHMPPQASPQFNQNNFNSNHGIGGGGAPSYNPDPNSSHHGGNKMRGGGQPSQDDLNSMSGMNGVGNGTISMADITGSADIMAFQGNEMLSRGSCSSYSFINEPDNDNLNRNFGYLDDNKDVNAMPQFTKANQSVPDTGGGGRSGGSGMQNSALQSAHDQMMAERQKDMNNNIGNMRY
jgi:hypothetical protein